MNSGSLSIVVPAFLLVGAVVETLVLVWLGRTRGSPVLVLAGWVGGAMTVVAAAAVYLVLR